MAKNNGIKKLSTGIKGFDELLYGGIQLHPTVNHDSCFHDGHGLIIAVRGARGCGKTLFALQLMHGLTKSLIEQLGEVKASPRFYSLNKSEDDLSNMYLDFIITKQIDRMIEESVSGYTDEGKSIGNAWRNNQLVKSLFDLAYSSEIQSNKYGSTIRLPSDYRENADKYLSERVLYYCTRTRALHFKRSCFNDDYSNLVFYLKRKSVKEYIDNHDFDPLPIHYKNDFVNIIFNNFKDYIENDYKEKDNSGNNEKFQYPVSPISLFNEITESLLTSITKKDSEQKKHIYAPCVVIDGFYQIGTGDLKKFPFSHLENILRKASPLSILVFDERFEEIKCNADLIIDMRCNVDSEEEYSFAELRIAKSVFQTIAFGWHQYKERSFGIEVFPSLHRLLQKRNYLPQALIYTHAGVLDKSYEEYLRNTARLDGNLLTPCLPSKSGEDCYEYYDKNKCKNKWELLKNIYRNYRKDCDTSDVDNLKLKLQNILFPSLLEDYKDRYPYSTVFIGNPNSFKRYFIFASAFAAAKRGEHTLIVLFDRSINDMRRHMVCPGISREQIRSDAANIPCLNENSEEIIWKCDTCDRNCRLRSGCLACYNHIHFFKIRMGCISAEEFFTVLGQQIDKRFKDGKYIRHVIIDDLQKIDFSFPFLKKTSLFLPALVSICRNRDIELKMLCNKKAGLTAEVCAIADNVVCIRRDKEDIENITLYLEKNASNTVPSEILEYKISGVYNLFCCGDNGVEFNAKFYLDGDTASNESLAKVIVSKIGSMKDYWRDTYNVIFDK